MTEGPELLVVAARAVGVTDARVLAVVAEVPRAEFVPEGWRDAAYDDHPIPIPHDQVTTQPSLVARMVEALELTGEELVLEIGTGFGWQTALLAELAAEVWSVERHPDLAEEARARLSRFPNAHVIAGDGSAGLPERAPFEAILVAAAFPRVPAPLAEQLRDGGRLVQPIGPGGVEDVTLFRRRGDRLLRERSVIGAHFVRLYGAHGYPEEAAPVERGAEEREW
jgi:protein-L-isoaspartate(D-aspartate) O-methyltransferase